MSDRFMFRAWDKKSEYMTPVHVLEYCHGGIRADGPGIHIGNGWCTEDNGFTHDCDVILMQCTGLRDKHGDLIYENDILELDDIIVEVTWHDGGFQMITSSSQGRSPAIQERVKNFTIIGNRYEKPGLLEKL